MFVLQFVQIQRGRPDVIFDLIIQYLLFSEVIFDFLLFSLTLCVFSLASVVARVGVEVAPPSSGAQAHWPVIGCWLLTILSSDWLLPEVGLSLRLLIGQRRSGAGPR